MLPLNESSIDFSVFNRLKLAACEQRGNGQPGEAKQQFPENKKKSQSKPHNPMLPGEDDDRNQLPAMASAPHGKAPVAASDSADLLT
jgi:hypothetical protein